MAQKCTSGRPTTPELSTKIYGGRNSPNFLAAFAMFWITNCMKFIAEVPFALRFLRSSYLIFWVVQPVVLSYTETTKKLLMTILEAVTHSLFPKSNTWVEKVEQRTYKSNHIWYSYSKFGLRPVPRCPNVYQSYIITMNRMNLIIRLNVIVPSPLASFKGLSH